MKRQRKVENEKKNEAYDYAEYTFTKKEHVAIIGVSVLLTGLISWLFYRSVIGMVCILIFCPFLYKSRKKQQIQKIQQTLCMEFKDALQSISSAMQAGYSIENAWREAQHDMQQLHGRESRMTQELIQMNTAIRLNIPLEQLLVDFAARSACEDIISFCQIFQFAKRSGGDFIKVMRVTAEHIQSKIEAQQEIDTLLASQRMEQKMMDVIPLGILAFINISSPQFLASLYGNPTGILVMTAALLGYAFAIWLSAKIGDVRC
ncbi:MAG: type II secretion system F family protein [Lachnospiraceae bacterium]